jgi:hypothetical protein
MVKVCIICQKELSNQEAYPIENSMVLDIIKNLKRKLKILKNNELFVCENCLEEYKKRRKNFENQLKFNAILSGVILFALLFLPLFFGSSLILTNFLILIIILGILILLSFSFYIPKIKQEKIFIQSQNLEYKEESLNQQNIKEKITTTQTQANLNTQALVPVASSPPATLELNKQADNIQKSFMESISSAQKAKVVSKKIKTKAQKKKKVLNKQKLTKTKAKNNKKSTIKKSKVIKKQKTKKTKR